MFFVPYSHIQIRSKLKVDEVERRLKDQLEPQSVVSGMFRGSHKYFQGSFENREFKISRIIHYRNSFRPVIVGKLQPEIDHTGIELIVRLDYVVLVVLLFIVLSFLGSFVLPIFSSLLQPLIFGERTEFLQYFPEGYWLKFVLSSIGACLLFYLFVMVPFNLEANKATKYLDELLESQRPAREN